MESLFYVKSDGDSKKSRPRAWKWVDVAVLAVFWQILEKIDDFWISGTKSGMHVDLRWFDAEHMTFFQK